MDKISKKGVLECLIRGVARVTFIVFYSFYSLLISVTDDLIDVVGTVGTKLLAVRSDCSIWRSPN